MHNYLKILLFLATWSCLITVGESLFDDKRCKCVCPNTKVVNGSVTDRRIYIKNVPAQYCNCEAVVIPMIPHNESINEKEFCPRCSCRYETRNSTTIRVVVIIVIWIISLLVIYMLFLKCLDPLLNKRTGSYQEHTDDDTTTETESTPMPSTSYVSSSTNVLSRVGHQQFKWKKQVQEQRRNIYDRHAMLN